MLHISQWCIFRVKLSCRQNFGLNHQWLNVYFMHWSPSNELFSLQCSQSKRLKAGEPNNWDEPGNITIQHYRKTPHPFFSFSVDDQIWQYNTLLQRFCDWLNCIIFVEEDEASVVADHLCVGAEAKRFKRLSLSRHPNLNCSQSFQQSGNILQAIDQITQNQSAKTQSQVALVTIIKALTPVIWWPHSKSLSNIQRWHCFSIQY